MTGREKELDKRILTEASQIRWGLAETSTDERWTAQVPGPFMFMPV